jgi:maleylacetate reductase
MAQQGIMGTTGTWSVAYGSGCLPQAVERELARTRSSRVLAVTSPRARASRPFADLAGLLDDRLVAVYDGVLPHVPRQTVLQARAAFAASDADAIVSFGGGATSDAGKALRLAIHFDLAGPESFDEVPQGVVGEAIPHIAVPTTVSGAEFSPAAGVTDEIRRRKFVLLRPGLAPTLAIIDPLVSADTPTALWATGLVKALGDSIEKVMETDLRPHLQPLVLQAAAWMVEALQPENLDRDEERLRAFLASWSTVFAGLQSGTSIGVATVLRHLLGPALGIPHAAVSAILLPHVYRLDCMAVPRDRHDRLAAALCVSSEEPGVAVAELLASTIAGVPVPSRLAAFGITAEQLTAIAPAAAREIRSACDFHVGLSDEAVAQLLLAAM